MNNIKIETDGNPVSVTVDGKPYEEKAHRWDLADAFNYGMRLGGFVEKPKLPTVEELRSAFAAVAPPNKSLYGAWFPECTVDWGYATTKSKFFAERIRKAERALGYSGFRAWRASHVRIESTPRVNVIGRIEASYDQFYGQETFYTENGARLYAGAMGDDLKHLL